MAETTKKTRVQIYLDDSQINLVNKLNKLGISTSLYVKVLFEEKLREKELEEVIKELEEEESKKRIKELEEIIKELEETQSK